MSTHAGGNERRRTGTAPDPGRVRFGTRGSALALAQTDLVMTAFGNRNPTITAERIVIRTDGDVDKTSPLTVIGGRGVFTSALEEALRRGIIDAAVHSAKDLPSESPPGLTLAAIFDREDPRDILVSRHGVSLADLPSNPVIGTSSRRRAAQIRAARPDARIVDLRGNIDTRLRKAMETDLDGVILAAAGVVRMGWSERIAEYLPLDRFIPSPGQGALAIETRANGDPHQALVASLDDAVVSLPVRVERAFLRGIGGGCTTPVGAHAAWIGDRLLLRCMLASDDGVRVTWTAETFSPADAEAGAFELAERVFDAVGRPQVTQRSTNGARPLRDLRVLVTRPGTPGTPLETGLRAAGAIPVSAPTIRITPPRETAPMDEAVREVGFGRYDWTIFTSGNAVDGMLRRVDALGLSPVIFGATRIAAIGDATAARLRAAGIEVDLVPDRFDGEAVRDAMLAKGMAGKRVLLPRGNLARDVIIDGLRSSGARVETVEAYRTEPVTALDPEIIAAIERGEFDVATFASSSCVRALATLLPNGLDWLRESAVACLGPVTAETARAHGMRVDIVAADATVPGLIRALIDGRDRIDAVRAERSRSLVGVGGGSRR